MKTFKIQFTNTSNKLDLVLIDSLTIGEAFDIAAQNLGVERLISIDEVEFNYSK